jgi:hypothetical protein
MALPEEQGQGQGPQDEMALPEEQGQGQGPQDEMALPEEQGEGQGPQDEMALPEEQGQGQGPQDEMALPEEQGEGKYNANAQGTMQSGEGLPENVSIAAKTIIDYAVGALAKQINSGNNSTQNPEAAFTNMTSKMASLNGGKSRRTRKTKTKIKGKKSRKA